MGSRICWLLLVVINVSYCEGNNFRFANNYGSNMVLQRAPQQAVLWGFGEVDQMVTLTINITEEIFSSHVYTDLHGFNVWKIKLPPIAEFGPFKITATSIWQTENVSAILHNVLFGDVWFCSGQSNMGFTVGMSLTGSDEIEMSSQYPNIRLFTTGRNYANEPVTDLKSENILQNWTVASKASVGGGAWTFFSAVCWMYGRRLYDLYKIPIGLIASKYGGTCAEAWSSPEALSHCGLKPPNQSSSISDEKTYSALWNAMIFPHLNTTITGVIWYQGEHNNIVNPDLYWCVFPSLIDDWRRKWYEGTKGSTNKTFPFGFVQLASIGEDFVAQRPFFPKIRWEQTANYGYVPNERQTNVFMAVAMDLPDDQSPYGSIHPRDKATVADRLILGARSMVYGENVKFQGPIIDNCYITKLSGVFVATIQYKGVEKEGMYLNNSYGFEALITGMTEWIQVQIVSLTEDKQGVTLSIPQYNISAIRYAWNHRPCDFKQCALYSVENQLPAPPAICYIT